MRLIREVLVALLCLAAIAAPSRSAQAADDEAVKTVQALYASYESALKDGSRDVKARAEAISGPMRESFDFPAMARVAVGPKWKSLPADQQASLTEAFVQHFIATYATRLSQAAGGTFEVTPKSEARAGNRVVRTRVSNAAGEDSDVDFVVNAGNRIQDVLLNGNVSEVAALRTSFADPLKAGGADALQKFLRERTEKMLAAKPAP
ncbi:phospholipid transport system substrate-binding protein [Methylobacterium sp. BE186]|uniref:MlaC/ttg2D family ABC transporter substrate-binding protein n=1 Tax=Methylobacterium sp. BE186 TaxID=2817715 RepID=UPI002856ED10|nr:ABC transporter substrate-binding protein [Methylobacterium sp. BE186]MDR7036729.1 phospholipid transport system substrate-binding protein [Methylobacterium sp. BE186]